MARRRGGRGVVCGVVVGGGAGGRLRHWPIMRAPEREAMVPTGTRGPDSPFVSPHHGPRTARATDRRVRWAAATARAARDP